MSELFGGTELQVNLLKNSLSPELLDNFQIIPTRLTEELNNDKIRIAWIHDLEGDPSLDYLKNEGWRKFHLLVFVSDNQMQNFIRYYNIPWSRCLVIKNAIMPLIIRENKNLDKIKLIYTPTPHRGLNILIPVFVELLKEFPYLELDVFSSFKLYGWENRDEPYKELFKFCENHPSISYHGAQPQEKVRKAISNSHIFAYPSTWTETSCQIAGSKILTKNGVKNIENIVIGDLVYTHKGNFKPVIDTFKREYKGELYKLKLVGSPNPVYFTPDHELYVGKVYTRNDSTGKRFYNNKIKSESWKEIKDIKKNFDCILRPKQTEFKNIEEIKLSDYINNEYWTLENDYLIPNIKNLFGKEVENVKNTIEMTKDLAWILGLFAGDGHAELNTNTLSFAHHSKDYSDAERVKNYFGEKCKIYTISENELSTKYHNVIYTEFFYNVVGKKREKKIPEFIWDCSLDIQKEFLNGYYAADGVKTTVRKSIDSVSPSLIFGISQIITNCGYFSSIRYDQKKNCYNIGWRENPERKYYHENEKYLGSRIDYLEKEEYEGFVYNFEVEDDHSYFTENISSHNCRCLMEAMSAGLVCVHSNLGALPETAANWTYMYQYQEDLNAHAVIFMNTLRIAINNLINDHENTLSRLKNQSIYADQVYNWDHRKLQWESLLTQMLNLPREFEKEIVFNYKTL